MTRLHEAIYDHYDQYCCKKVNQRILRGVNEREDQVADEGSTQENGHQHVGRKIEESAISAGYEQENADMKDSHAYCSGNDK